MVSSSPDAQPARSAIAPCPWSPSRDRRISTSIPTSTMAASPLAVPWCVLVAMRSPLPNLSKWLVEPVAYAVNDFLTSDASGNFTKAGVDAGGKTVPICGVVSVATNGAARINALGTKTYSNYDIPLLTFWTAYLPCAGV